MTHHHRLRDVRRPQTHIRRILRTEADGQKRKHVGHRHRQGRHHREIRQHLPHAREDNLQEEITTPLRYHSQTAAKR